MIRCLVYLVIIYFLSACTPQDVSRSTEADDQSTNLESEIPIKDAPSNSGNTSLLVASSDMGNDDTIPFVSNVRDSEALFHWRPILNEDPEQVGISLSGSAFIDEQGLNLTGNDAFAEYILDTALMVDEIINSNELFIRLWIKSDKNEQEGPARIFTWSSGTDNRNLTIGHGNHEMPNDKLIVRLRLNLEEDRSFLQGQQNRQNILESEDNVLSVSDDWQRIEIQYYEGFVYLWINDQIIMRDMSPYNLSAWDNTMSFGFGQEFNLVEMPTGSLRAWSGHIAEIAIYSKAQKQVNLE